MRSTLLLHKELVQKTIGGYANAVQTVGKLNLPQETSLNYYGESVPPQHP